jgi:hypothetical protein
VVPFSYSATDHQGLSGVQMGTITNGALVVRGTPIVATDAGNLHAYTAAPAAPPVNGIPKAKS